MVYMWYLMLANPPLNGCANNYLCLGLGRALYNVNGGPQNHPLFSSWSLQLMKVLGDRSSCQVSSHMDHGFYFLRSCLEDRFIYSFYF